MTELTPTEEILFYYLQGAWDDDEGEKFDAWLAEVRAKAWDAAVAAMRYEDGMPVEIVKTVNPYRPVGVGVSPDLLEVSDES